MLGAVAALTAAPAPVEADARTDYLVRLLRTSTTFRVRAQAALSLGRLDSDPAIVAALGEALSDVHPAVRTASAASLEGIGDPAALDALRRHRRDRDRTARAAVERAIRSLERVARSRPQTTPVPAEPPPSVGPARYYVGVGMPGSSAGVDRDVLRRARDLIAGRVGQIEGVVVAPGTESNSQVSAVLRRRNLAGYYLDSSIVRVEEGSAGTRAVVSVIVNTYPGRDMRVILQGAATVQGGGRGSTVQMQAIEGAITGALRRLPQALAAGDAHNGG